MTSFLFKNHTLRHYYTQTTYQQFQKINLCYSKGYPAIP